MTTLLSTHDIGQIVGALGLPELLRRLEAELAADFRRWPDFDKTARTASHSASGVIELMPTADARHYCFKYVNGHPGNPALGLPTVMAFGVLADVATGLPTLLSELTITTALRTAATSVLAARLLARPGSRTMALIGNGAQSEFQALAFHHLLSVQTLRLYDIDPAATAKLQRNLQALPGLQVVACESTAQALQGADIVTTLTADKRRAVIVTPDMLAPGMHLNAVGGDCPGKTELHKDILLRSQIFVEYPEQTRIEGEIQQLDPDHPVTELWQVILGQAKGRHDARAITLFDSVGFAVEDFSALRYVRSKLAETGLCTQLDMIADPDDPRDLFGMILRAG